MIKFFRKIRQKLLAENKFSKYLIYSIGEIFLVVIGILIALSVNNSNQDRLDKRSVRQCLVDLKIEIQGNNALLNHGKAILPYKIEGLLAAKKNIEENIEIKDTIAFVKTVLQGCQITKGLEILNRNAYNEVLSTGNIQLISKIPLKVNINRYYWELGVQASHIENHKSVIENFISGLRPYNPYNRNYISKYDIDEMMTAFRSEEFRKIVEHELSYAYTLKYAIDGIDGTDGLVETGLETIQLIDTEINNK